MRCKARLIFVLSLWLAVASTVAPQSTRPPKLPLPTGDFCETNVTNLDLAHSEAGEDGLIIAIARLGNGERNRDLNHRRLYNLRTYLERFRKRASKTIITAEGERVKAPGRIEIYVGGKLFIAIELRRGEDFHVGSCNATSKLDTLFYDSRNRSGRGVYIPPSGTTVPNNKN